MEQRLKERLFGAVIIVSVFVIFLPMVLKEPQDTSFAHDDYQAQPELQDIEATLQVPETLATWAQTIESSQESRETQASQSWVVQLATFANPANAHKLLKDLKSNGYDAYLEAVPGHQDSLTWVMVGPVENKEKAMENQAELLSKFKMKGLVLSSNNKG